MAINGYGGLNSVYGGLTGGLGTIGRGLGSAWGGLTGLLGGGSTPQKPGADPNQYGAGDYTYGPDQYGYGGPGEIAGGGQVNLKGINLPYFTQDRERLGGMLDGRNAFAGQEWGNLISQLQARANGQGPSLAGNAYRSAAADTTNSLASMARGSAGPGAARAAAIQRARVGQGLASGYANADLQERLGAQSALQEAISSRDQLNQKAYLDILGKQLGLSQDQLKALQGNQNYAIENNKNDTQRHANAANAVASMFGGMGMLMSDTRLKTDIVKVDDHNGIPVYDFSYIGQPGRYRGVMAQEVREILPDAVGVHPSGYLMVDYVKVGYPFKRIG